MTAEWQCPYCKQWRSVQYTGCTHAHIETRYDPVTRTSRTVLGGKDETWTAQRKPEWPTRDSQQGSAATNETKNSA